MYCVMRASVPSLYNVYRRYDMTSVLFDTQATSWNSTIVLTSTEDYWQDIALHVYVISKNPAMYTVYTLCTRYTLY